MIVVDTNILSYLYLPTQYSTLAEQLLIVEPEWVAPYLWRSEFRNVLTLYLRKELINYDKALQILCEAEALMHNHEYSLNSFDILSVIKNSVCSAYDCEFVTLALSLQTKLITEDKKILRNFPKISMSLQKALSINSLS